MTTSTAVPVCPNSTRVRDLDVLLADATPETLTAALVCLRLASLSNPLGDRLKAAIEARVAPFREGDFEDRDPLAEVRPTQLWLDVPGRVESEFTEYGLDGADDYVEAEVSPAMRELDQAMCGDEDARRRSVQAALRRAHTPKGGAV